MKKPNNDSDATSRRQVAISIGTNLIEELNEAVRLMRDRPLPDADELVAERIEAAARAWDTIPPPRIDARQARHICSVLDAAKQNVVVGVCS